MFVSADQLDYDAVGRQLPAGFEYVDHRSATTNFSRRFHSESRLVEEIFVEVHGNGDDRKVIPLPSPEPLPDSILEVPEQLAIGIF